MTRAEVAALTLALHVLRANPRDWRPWFSPGVWNDPRTASGHDALIDRAHEALDLGAADEHGIDSDIRNAERLNKHGHPSGYPLHPPRILRARLALYIRAVLRAERGDRGFCWVRRLNSWLYSPDYEERSAYWYRQGHRGRETYRLARPLWLDAKEHR